MNSQRFIYVLLDEQGLPLYVGQSVAPARRFREHKGINPSFITFMVVEKVSPEFTWQEREKFWILLLKLQGYDLLNKNEGGNGSDYRHSEEAKKKISEASKKAAATRPPVSLEHRKNLSISHSGLKRSSDSRIKQSNTMTGQKKTIQHAENIRKAMMGHPMSEETKRKISQTKKLKGT